jgi:uncharacterized membrane protein YccC
MSETTSPTQTHPAVSVLFGLLALVAAWAGLRGIRLPLIGTERAAFLAFAGLGFLMCAIGPQSRVWTGRSWLKPYILAGIVLGVVALMLAWMVLFGVDIPGIGSLRQAFWVLAGIMVVKVVLGLYARIDLRRG